MLKLMQISKNAAFTNLPTFRLEQFVPWPTTGFRPTGKNKRTKLKTLSPLLYFKDNKVMHQIMRSTCAVYIKITRARIFAFLEAFDL